MALLCNSYYRVDRAQIYASLDRRNYLRNNWTSVIKSSCINTRQNIWFKLNDEKGFYFVGLYFFSCRKSLNMNCTPGNHFNQQFNWMLLGQTTNHVISQNNSWLFSEHSWHVCESLKNGHLQWQMKFCQNNHSIWYSFSISRWISFLYLVYKKKLQFEQLC